MSDVAQRLSPVTATSDTVHHYVECHDNNRSLCGVDLTGVPWTDEPIDCVVCVELGASEPEVCTCSCCSLDENEDFS